MTVRSHRPYADLRSELATTKWLLAQARTRLAALEAVEPSEPELKDALAYADGLGGCQVDRVPLKILAAAVRSLRREQRLAKRLGSEGR